MYIEVRGDFEEWKPSGSD